MKAIKVGDDLKFNSEPGDTKADVELRENLNKLLDALKFFHSRGIRLKIAHKPKGYTMTFSKA